MSNIDKSKPDVLKVTEFILEKGKLRERFSVCEAAKTQELNGIDEYRIAEIMREICLQPNGPDSIDELTHISNDYLHNNPGNWQLNASTYFGYLSHLSVNESQKANKTATLALWIAAISALLTFMSIIVPVIAG